MIVHMARVRIFGPRERLDETLRVVQDLGVLHIASPPPQPNLSAFHFSPGAARRRRQLQRILDDVEAALAGLGAGASVKTPPEASVSDLARWAVLARRTRRAVKRLADRKAELEEERALLAKYHGFLAAFESLLSAQGKAQGAMAFHLILRPDQADAVPSLKSALHELLEGAFEVFTHRLEGGETALLLLVPASSMGEVERLLSRVRVHEIALPSGYGGSLAEAMPRMREREAAIPGELDTLERERGELRRSHLTELVGAQAAVRDRLMRMEALPLSAVTTHAFVLDGWLPASGMAKLTQVVTKACGPEVVVETVGRERWGGEEAPVVLTNPRLFRPFELLTRMVPLPHYGTLDPTPFVAVFFPALFGVILGDAGYAFFLGLLALILHRRSSPGTTLRSVSEVAGACALFSGTFGILFGEYFGDLGRRWLGLKPLWMNREEAILPFLGLAIAIGLVHVLLGLVLGMLSSIRAHPRQALGRGLSILMILLILMAILAAVRVLPHGLLTPVSIAILLAFPILVVVEGIVAPVELLSTFGHILSYARIMALGTASVMLAIVANQMVGALGSVTVGVMFALLFHLVNFAIGLFTPTIHALRLHYVEFFGTFYSPGGVPYRPLGHWRPSAGPTA